MQVTIEVGELQAYALQKVCDEANAARPLDADGVPVGPELTPETYLQARNADLLLDYCRQHARISGASFIDRFTANEWARLKAARASNPAIAAAAAPLLAGQRVELAGPLAQEGVALLASLPGLLDTPVEDRVAALLAPPQPHEVA